MLWPSLGSHVGGVIDSLLASFAFLLVLRARNAIVQFVARIWRSLAVLISGKRYVLIWNDVDVLYSHRLIEALKSDLAHRRLRVLRSPLQLQRYYLGPRIVSAIVLIDTDVTKFATDARQAKRLQRQLTRFLMRGGGIVGTHDVIYSRVRNEQLQAAFGGSITDFARTTDPVRYVRTAQGRSHPLSKDLPEGFDLDDGEIIWGNWSKDVTIHYETNLERKTPLVVSRSYWNGRLVWVNSGDKGLTLARSVSEPQSGFVQVMLNAVRWVSRHADDTKETRQVVAHRGASLLRHENTLEAFALAISCGADYAELDVRRTLDGVMVVHHDAEINEKLIASADLITLQEAARGRGYTVATLNEVLNLCKGKIKLDIELKEEGYEEEVVSLIRGLLSDGEFVITSFSDLSLRRIKLLYTNVRCGLLLGHPNPKNVILTRLSELFPTSRAMRIGADFVAPHYRLVRFGFSKRVRARGLPMWVWTVDDPRLMRKLLRDRSVEAIITNAPDLALKERARATEEM